MGRADRSLRTDVLGALGTAAAVIGVFLPVIHHGWALYDDDLDIYENPFLGLSGKALAWMFGDASYRGRYMPLSWLSWSLNLGLTGPNPAAFHAVDLVLHAANAVLLYFVLRKLFDKLPVWSAGVGALVWALHPLRVELVALASNRTYSQALFFLLGSALFWLLGKKRWSVGAYALSMLTFPLAPLYPFVLALKDRTLKDKKPLLAVSALFLATVLFKPSSAGLPPLPRAAIHAGYALGHSLWKPLAPVRLRPVYPDLVDLPAAAPRALAGFLLAALLAGLAWSRRKKSPGLLNAAAAHLLLLAPFLGLMDARPLVCADRYAAVYGLVLAGVATWALAAMSRKTPEGTFCVSLALVGALAYGAVANLPHWKNPVTFWTYMESQDLGPGRPRALWKLAFVQWRDDGDSSAALKTLSTLEEIGPLSGPALALRGAIMAELGSTKAAKADLDAAASAPMHPTLAYDMRRVSVESARRAEKR